MSTHQESDFIETDMSSESGPDAPPSYHVAVASQEGEQYLDDKFLTWLGITLSQE